MLGGCWRRGPYKRGTTVHDTRSGIFLTDHIYFSLIVIDSEVNSDVCCACLVWGRNTSYQLDRLNDA